MSLLVTTVSCKEASFLQPGTKPKAPPELHRAESDGGEFSALEHAHETGHPKVMDIALGIHGKSHRECKENGLYHCFCYSKGMRYFGSGKVTGLGDR